MTASSPPTAWGAEVLATDDLFARVDGQRFTLDVETAPIPQYTHDKAALVWHQSQPVGFSLVCPPTGIRCYVPVTDENRNRAGVFLRRLVANPANTVTGHNIKFDIHALGIDPTTPDFRAGIEDTSTMVHLHDPNDPKRLELIEPLLLYTRRKGDHLEGKRGKAKNVGTWPLQEQSEYCVDDGQITWELREKLWPRLERRGLLPLFRKEMRYLRLLWQVERRGVLIDWDVVADARCELQERRAVLEKHLYRQCGRAFNWASPQQLSDALYRHLGVRRPVDPMPDRYHTTTKHYTATLTSSFLLAQKVKHPVAGTVLALREAAKLDQTLALWERVADTQGVLHTSFNQTGTVTGRLSSSTPNLQNITGAVRRAAAEAAYGAAGLTRTGAFALRRGIIARPGYTLVAIDYRQQEARMLALLAQDANLLSRVRGTGDVHSDVAALVWGSRDPIHRRWAKDLTFALCYGMTTDSLAEMLNVRPLEAARITSQYFRAFPRVQPYLRERARFCEEHGYIRYWSGRLWRPKNYRHSYKAVNAEIQGGCAEITSIAALRCGAWLKEDGCGHLLLIVHDELVFEIDPVALPYAVPKLQALMAVEDIFDLGFPTGVKTGQNYGELAEYVS